jgi:hypothetical protein
LRLRTQKLQIYSKDSSLAYCFYIDVERTTLGYLDILFKFRVFCQLLFILELSLNKTIIVKRVGEKRLALITFSNLGMNESRRADLYQEIDVFFWVQSKWILVIERQNDKLLMVDAQRDDFWFGSRVCKDNLEVVLFR